MKEIWYQTDGKGSSILVAIFLDHCEYPSFILPQTSKSAGFLKINCHIESETMFMNFFVICYISLSIP